MTFKTIETQEELDKILKDRLERQKESYTKQLADYDQLKNQTEALTTENSALQATISETSEKVKGFNQEKADLTAKIAGYETSQLRTQIALKHGLPIDLADRLVGDDETTLTQDAERLSEFVKPMTPVPPLANPEPSLGDGKDAHYKNLIENLNMEE